MSKLPYLPCATTLLLAYEIRPGVLVMPRYAQDGQVWEVGMEKRRYSPN